MQLIPDSRFALDTQLSPAEVVAALRGSIYSGSPTARTSTMGWPYPSAFPFQGRVGENDFAVRAINPIQGIAAGPVVVGVIKATPSGSVIQGRLQMRGLSLVMPIVWFALATAFAVAIARAGHRQSLFLFLGIVVIALVTTGMSLAVGRRKALQTLAKVVKASVPVSPA